MRAALLQSLRDLDKQLSQGPVVSGRVWEALGSAWADAGA